MATLDAEIVNADAFCLYRGMDIGTAKPTLADWRAVLITRSTPVTCAGRGGCCGLLGLRARRDRGAIQKRGRTALLVGGSGLYVQAVLDDLRFPPTDPQVRQRLEQELLGLLAGSDARTSCEDRSGSRRGDPTATADGSSGHLRSTRSLASPSLPPPGPAPDRSPSLRIGWDPGAEHVIAIAQRCFDDVGGRLAARSACASADPRTNGVASGRHRRSRCADA
ncbi:MAG: hypothetical protein H6526_09825 [Actinobacteria bacterium]|nr:hypothetical protein [Actinomycetota bacterium]